ncbi:MAG: T9SS type A sorting domain-containing protein [Bacteroidetes bacterium]|nr:T9SS type A sorting domain-containing protein [Bacteroidota bacterium]
MRKYLIPTILLFTSFSLKAQSPPMLTAFEVNRFQNNILVDWEIAAGNFCTGLKVEHSTDSVNFVSIYDYPGICGNTTVNERYSFLHTNPVSNVRNYYRINLNTNGISDILGITFIKLEETGYALFPMPLTSNSKLYFNNDKKENVTLVIYNSAGAKVHEQQGIKNNEVNMGNLVLPAGLYHFNVIIAEKRNIEGKFVIVKD